MADYRYKKGDKTTGWLRTVLDAVNDPVLVQDAANGVIRDANLSACETFGYRIKEICTLGPAEISSGETPYDGDHYRSWMARSVETGPQVIEWHCRTRDGSLFWGEVAMKYAASLAEPCVVATFRNITSRKQVEEEALRNASMLRSLLSSSSVGIALLNENGTIELTNNGMTAISGRSEEELKGRGIGQFLSNDEERARVDEILRAASLSGGMAMEGTWVRKDGSFLHVRLHFTSIDAGDHSAIALTLEDITPITEVRRALEESEEKYRILFDHAPVALIEADGSDAKAYIDRIRASGVDNMEEYVDEHPEAPAECLALLRHTAINKAGLKIHGVADVNELNDLLISRLADAPPDLTRQDFLSIAEGRGFEREGIHPASGGRTVWVYSRWTLMPRSEKTYSRILMAEVDLTKRKNVEEALRKSEEVYREIFENAAEGIFQSTLEGRFLNVNPAYSRMLGYDSPQEMIESIVDIGKQLYFDEDRKAVLEAVEKHTGSEFSRSVRRLRRKDGSPIWVSMNARPIRNADGSIRHLEGIAQNVTERTLAEEALKESEERYRSMFDHSAAVMLLIDHRTGRLVDVNAAAHSFYGYRREELLRMTIGDITDLGENELQAELTAASMRWRSHFSHRHRLSNGEVRDVEIYTGPVSVSGENLLFSIVHDITARKIAEQALAESEERYRTAIENSNDGAILIDNDDNRLYVNQRFVELCGAESLEEVLNSPRYRFIHPDDREKMMGFRVARKEGRDTPDRFEYRGLKKDNTIVYLEGVVAPITISGRPYHFLFVRDITDRKKAEQALAESEERFWTTIEKSNEGIALIKGYDHIYVNQRWLDMFGFASADDVPHTQGPLPVIHPDDAGRMAEYADAVSKGETIPTWLEFRGLRADGKTLHMEASISPTVFHGELVYLLFTRDVTERKKTEETLREAKEAAEAATLAKSLFLANMSHEIRTPMNAIVGLTHLAMKSRSAQKQQEYLAKIQGSTRVLLGIIDDILDVSKIEAGKLRLESATLRLDSLIQQVSSMMGYRAKEKGLGLSFKISPEIPALFKSDHLRLTQVLLNLVGNAVKFTSAGNVTVIADLVERSEGRAKLRFSIRDTGIGIPPEHSDSLFQAFDQLDTSTTRRYGGTGLGLYISKKIVEAMGGTITVESTPGVGSVFTFTIDVETLEGSKAPGEGDRSVSGETAMMEASGQLAKKRILVVEDNDINMQIVREILEEFGAVTDGAASGKDALRMIDEAAPPYDAILMDVQMPEMDGYEVTRAIRQKPDLSSLPVIATTAHTGESERRRCLDAGMNDYVSKPIEPYELIATVSEWITPEGAPKGPHKENETPESGENLTARATQDAIDIEAAVRRLSGNRTLFLRLLGDFCRDYSDAGDRIREALAAEERERAHRMAHTLNGVSGNLSITDVHRLSAAIETAILSHDDGRMDELLDRLDESIGAAMETSARLQAEEDERRQEPATIAGGDPAAASLLLTQLYNQLGKRNLGARRFFMMCKGEFTTPETSSLITECERALDRLDFPKARELVGSVARIFGVNPDSRNQ